MAIADPIRFQGGERPELFFGLVSAVGAPVGYFSDAILEPALHRRGYEVRHIRVSDYLSDPDNITLQPEPPKPNAPTFDRICALMSRGDDLRHRVGAEALALYVAADINSHRDDATSHFPRTAWIINQLKHPAEAEWLRRVYGDAFHLIGLYTPRPNRERHLQVFGGMSSDQAQLLITRDASEPDKWGQQLTDTFHLADVFVEMKDETVGESANAENELERYFKLMFGEELLTPTKDEYGMNMARAAALRSADLSRQVGACILSLRGDVLSVGTNDVPASGGGLYWGGEYDARDFKVGYDSNAAMRRRTLRELLSRTEPHLSTEEQGHRCDELIEQLAGTRVVNLTEFGRAVHAEMEALLAASRSTVSVFGATLYCTTYPCHNCTKHIIASGISRVVYIEPYPKSLAKDLHGDAIWSDEDPEEPGNRIRFDPFAGIAPRRYVRLFSTVTPEGRRFKRKDSHGTFDLEEGLRISGTPYSYILREALAAEALDVKMDLLSDQSRLDFKK